MKILKNEKKFKNAKKKKIGTVIERKKMKNPKTKLLKIIVKIKDNNL